VVEISTLHIMAAEKKNQHYKFIFHHVLINFRCYKCLERDVVLSSNL